jgi:hypothetical protein
MTIEERLQKLEDINEIRQLKARYSSCADVGWQGEPVDRKNTLIDEVFAENIVYEVLTAEGNADRFVGREEVRSRYDTAIGPFQFGIHLVSEPRLEVDGDNAEGEWPVIVPLIDPNGHAKWFAGKYVEKYAREDGRWRITYLRQVVALYTSFDDPWAAGVMK